jgi:trimeric autotransporter adhesin
MNNFTRKCRSFFSFLALLAIANVAYSQCQVSLPSSTTPTAGCSTTNLSLGAGECRTLNVSTATYFTFSFSNNAQSNGFCVNGTQYTSTTTLLLSANATICMFRANSTWTTTSATLTYTKTTPSLTANTPTSATICTGGTVSISRGTGTSATNIYWQGTTSNGTSTATTTTPQSVTAAGTYYWRPVNNDCWGTQQATTVTVVADPTAPSVSGFNIASGSTICIGATISATTLTAGSGGTGCSADSYQYSTDGGSTWNTFNASTSYTASSTGTNQFQVRARRACSGNGCNPNPADNLYTWNVEADPTAPSVSGFNIAPGTTICIGATISASTLSAGSGGTGCTADAYQYSTDGGTTWNTFNASTSYAATSAGTNRFQVRARRACSGGGCNPNPADNLYTWNVVLDPAAPTAVKSPNVASVCEGQTLTLTGVTDNGGGTGTCNIEYSVNGGGWSTVFPSFSATVGTNTIEIRKSCSGIGCDISGTNLYSWDVEADPSITSQTNTVNLCKGGSTIFTVSATGGTPSLTYQWQYNNGGTWENVGANPTGVTYSGATTASLTVNTSVTTVATSYQYRVLVNASGSDCNQATPNTTTLNVLEVPSVNSQPVTVNICEGGTANFSASGTGGIAPLSYQWEYFNGTSWGNVTNGTPTGASYTGGTTTNLAVTGLNGGTGTATYPYRFKVISSAGAGCSDALSNTANAVVSRRPNITSSASGMCEGESKTLTTDIDGTSGVFWDVSPLCPGCLSGNVFTAPNPGVAGSASYTLEAYNSNNPSCFRTYNQSIFAPDPADAGPNQEQCNNSSFTMAGSAPLYGSTNVTWALIAGSATGFTNSPTTSVNVPAGTPPGSGFATFRYRFTNGACISDDFVTLTNYATPTTATVGATQNLCGTLTSANLGGNTPTNGTGLWTQVSGPGTSTFNSATSGSSTATADAYGTYVYRWTISNGICTPSIADITVSYTEQATAGADQQICATLTSGALGGITPTVGSGLWTQVAGPGSTTFSSATSGSSTATADAYGTYTYRWTVSGPDNLCSTFEDVVVSYTEQATVGADQEICGFTSTTLGGNTPSAGTGLWTQISGPGTTTFSSATSGSSTATASTVGTYVYRWTLTSPGSTCNTFDEISVVFVEIADVPALQEVCGLVSSSLGGNTPAIGSGLWTQISGPGTTTFSNDVDGSSTATATNYGTYVYRWTITGPTNACNTFDDITVIFYDDPSNASAGAEQDICASLTSLSLGGNTPIIGTGIWTQFSGPGTSSFSPNTNDPSAAATATLYGTYVYHWTITNGVCPPGIASITVNYTEQATAGADQDICAGLTSGTLGGNTPTVGSGLWTQTSGPGTTTFSSATSGSSTATADAYGTYVYRWTVSGPNSGCSTFEEVTVNYTEQATAGADQDICAGLTSGSLGGNTPTVGSGLWTQTSGPGTTTFSSATSGSSTATADAYGTYVYRWTVSGPNSGCSTFEEVTVNYTEQATAGADQDICAGLTSGTLGGNTPTVGSGLWTQTSGPGTTTFSSATSGSSTATADAYGNERHTGRQHTDCRQWLMDVHVTATVGL